jgi:hypothetical protein
MTQERSMTKQVKQDKQADQYVVHKIDAGTWSIQKKAVPGFRLSKSTMAAARRPVAGRSGNSRPR